jgi:hypothetical protein
LRDDAGQHDQRDGVRRQSSPAKGMRINPQSPVASNNQKNPGHPEPKGEW